MIAHLVVKHYFTKFISQTVSSYTHGKKSFTQVALNLFGLLLQFKNLVLFSNVLRINPWLFRFLPGGYDFSISILHSKIIKKLVEFIIYPLQQSLSGQEKQFLTRLLRDMLPWGVSSSGGFLLKVGPH